MISDARNIDAARTRGYDVCVIGAGPAGITVALQLAGSGASVAILEAGGVRYERRVQRLNQGKVSGLRYPDLSDTRMSALGGTSKVWAGWCRPLDALDFERRDWVSHSGWPFGPEALSAAYGKAHQLCGLGDPEYDPVAWERRSGHERLPIRDEDLVDSVFQVSPIDFGETFRKDLEASPDLHLFLHAIVLRLDRTFGTEHVASARVATLEGSRFDLRARVFVLAAGGIENARLLLLSGESPERSIGNEHGLVGRYFTEHAFVDPGTFVARSPMHSLDFYLPKHVEGIPSASRMRSAFSLSRETLTRERLLNSALFFRPAYEAHPVFATAEVRSLLDLWDSLRGRGVPGHGFHKAVRALRAPQRLAVAVSRKLVVRDSRARRRPMRAFFECESQKGSRVRLGRQRDELGRPLPEIEWRLSELDIRSMRYAWRTLDGALRNQSIGHLELAFEDEIEAWLEACEGGKHHMGTTRMHASPRHGVVDADARVHGTSNLYVAGSSVFPTGGFANPTLTIVALAVRLGGHLRRLL